jgi:hypothetical protein
MFFDYVNDNNFMMFAIKHYNSPSCTGETEFREDLSRIRSIGRSFSRYRKTGKINERLVLNHLIVLYNVFEAQAMTKMLAFKLNNYLDYLKPFLMLISMWPDKIEGVGGDYIITGSDIFMDNQLVKKLREI